MKITLDNMARPDLFCRLWRELVDEALREHGVFAMCRDLIARGVPMPPEIALTLDHDGIVVEVEGREVARERLPQDREDWFFEDGPWVRTVERLAENCAVALPMAA
jgi:hypothetical protein